MALFGKKKKADKQSQEDIDREIAEIKASLEGGTAAQPQGKEEGGREETIHDKAEKTSHAPFKSELKPPPKQKVDGSPPAPLFVKLDKYRNILVTLGHMKATIAALKNSFSMLEELEKTKNETMGMMKKAMQGMESRISALDEELVRPAGFRDVASNANYEEVANVEATIADLRGQIEQLKAELEQMA